jgi:hypothetical protein
LHRQNQCTLQFVLLVCTVYSVLYSEIALSRKQFEIGHMYIYTFLLRMTDTVTSQNIALSSWDILYISINHLQVKVRKQLCLTNLALHHEGVWESGCIDTRFFTSTLVGGELSASHSGRFSLSKEPRKPTGWGLGWPQTQSRRRGENCCSYRNSNSDRSVVQHVASRCYHLY